MEKQHGGLAVHGNQDCWSAKVLIGIWVKLGENSSINSVLIDDICMTANDVDRVVGIHTRVLQPLTTAHTDPRTYPSEGGQSSACTCIALHI